MGAESGWHQGIGDSTLRLPGSLDENGIGDPVVSPSVLDGLSRKVSFTGAVWVSKRIELPADWVGRPLKLCLERAHWFTDLWVNGHHVGSGDSLSIPHRYRIPSNLVEASLLVVVRIDNTVKIPVGKIGHALTDWTQTNWNGVIGKTMIEPEEFGLAQLRMTPSANEIVVDGSLSEDGLLELTIGDNTVTTEIVAGKPFSINLATTGLTPWSDQEPELHNLNLRLNGQASQRSVGFRSFKAVGKLFRLNDNPVFLRGTLECCVFPKTGYPPMQVDCWKDVFSKVREFGLNHVRFHSWCPPEAAFLAADELGVILQVELPVWTGLWPISSHEGLMDFCRRESHRILDEYGHHPSFALFGLGNEIAFYGHEPLVDELLVDLKSAYPNQLFNFSAHGTYLSSVCDYYAQADNGKPGELNRPLRGSTWFGVGSRFDRESPCSLSTVQEAADQFDRPVISHEVAEWAVFPDVHNADRYEGVLEANNFREIANSVDGRGMLDQTRDFVYCSGKLSAQLYKEEIETLLRTSGLAGYQLLGLSDFPGQGTATIGMLDAFWQEKGFVKGNEFRAFCADTVPLLKLPKVVWSSQETLVADIEVHRSGTTTTGDCSWTVQDSKGNVLVDGHLGTHTFQAGKNAAIGSLQMVIDAHMCGQKLLVTVKVGESVNSWPIWVMPSEEISFHPGEILVTSFYREDVRQRLLSGGSVWLRMNPGRVWGGIPGRFAPAFWSPIHFKEQVGTMGTVIDSTHSVFDRFPTERYTEWQWWDILTRSKALNVNALPKSFRPLIQVIDRYERNDKLATVFETKVGDGKLFVSLIDFDDIASRPATSSLQSAIHHYLKEGFEPSQTISIAELDRVFYREP